MTDEDAQHYRDLTLQVYRQIHQIRAGHEALVRMVVESFPEPERVAALDRYEKYKAQIEQEVLLKLEASSPNFAAELDRHRPLLPPDDAP